VSDIIKIIVNGKSMNQLLQKSDEVFGKETDRYRFGDIILFRDYNEVYIHRIIFRFLNIIIQTGDNSLRCSRIKKEDIIAKAICINNNDMTDLQNRSLNYCCALIDIALIIIQKSYASKMNVIRAPFAGKIYLRLIRKRNSLHLKYFN
jgi:hypothetical protein